MFSIFSKKHDESLDLSFLQADMHSHLLPQIDDGSESMDQTIHFIKEMKALGYKKLICTPHILPDVHDNNPTIILAKLKEVQEVISNQKIDITIEAAAEYMVGPEFQQTINNNEEILCFGKEKFVLIEMSYAYPSKNIEQVIFDLMIKGYQPILAHPERYNYLLGQKNVFESFVQKGCLLQMNLLSLTGIYGKPVMMAAEYLMKKRLISFIGTDMHHQGHLNIIKKFATNKKFHQKVQELNLLNQNLI